MGPGDMRVVKRAVEEGIELMGYAFIFIGVLEWLGWLKSEKIS